MSWNDDRMLIVGASEISTVIRATQSEQQIKEAMGGSAGSYIDEQDFKTPFELYHLKQGNLDSKKFSSVLSEFGHKMELFAEWYLNKYFNVNVKCQPQEVKFSDLHSLAGYTPDILGIVKDDILLKGKKLSRFDRVCVEVKTVNFYTAKKENVETKGLKWQYIIQNQYQLWQESNRNKSYKHGILCWIVPKEAEYDKELYKGKAIAYIDTKNFDMILKYYDIDFLVYPVYESLHPMFINALDTWEGMLANKIEPQPDFLRDYDDYNKLFNNKKNIDEIISYANVKYGVDNGYVKLNQLTNFENIKDEANKFYLKCSEYSALKKEIDSDKARWNEFFSRLNILGIDDDDFTIKNCASGRGRTVKCNFKNSEERASGSIGSDKY